jgi:hypothetical protein
MEVMWQLQAPTALPTVNGRLLGLLTMFGNFEEEEICPSWEYNHDFCKV